LKSLCGDFVITCLSREWSTKAGSDLPAYLMKHDASMRSVEERNTVAEHLCAVAIKEGQSLWIPFGMLHVVTGMPSSRETKKAAPVKGGKKPKPGPRKKDAASEYGSLLWLPCVLTTAAVAAQDADGAAKVLARLVAWRQWVHERVQKDENWIAFVHEMEKKAKDSGKKVEEVAEEDAKESSGSEAR
jgi:hypothetical protein